MKWLKVLFNALLSLGIVLSMVSIAAASSWMPYNGHWYTLSNHGTWAAAETEAKALGGHLVTINDAAENAWLAETFAHYPGYHYTGAYIGYFFNSIENDWQWISGEPVTYTNLWSDWDLYPGNFAYIHTNDHPFATKGSWNHAYWVTDDPSARGVIEVSTSPVPEPTVYVMLLVGAGLLSIVRLQRHTQGGRVANLEYC